METSRSRRTMIATGASMAMALAACGTDGAGTAGGRVDQAGLEVLASAYPIAEAAERVGGDRVRVTNLTPAGSEPHDLELTPDQVEDLEDAALVIVLGRGFQPAVEAVADRREGVTVELLDALPVDLEGMVADDHGDEPAAEHEPGAEDEPAADEHSGEEGTIDPHVWLDPSLMAAIVDEVTAALVELDPEGAAEIEANAAAYRSELEELEGELDEVLGDCDRSTVVVAHEAFGWLTERYGLRQEGIAGLTPGAETDPARLAELTDLVEDEGVTTVFTEPLVPSGPVEALAREAGVGTAVLDPLEGLSDDQLAEGATYASVMRTNLQVLAEALGCG